MACALLLAGAAGGQEEKAPEADLSGAKDCVALLLDNQPRCSKVAGGQTELLEARYSSDQRAAEIDHYLAVEARVDVQAARNTIDVVHQLSAGLYSGGSDAAIESVNEMLGAQESLCDLATQPAHWQTATEYRQLIHEQASRFQTALRSLPREAQPSVEERQQAVRKYRGQIFADWGDSPVASSGGERSPLPPPRAAPPPISASEYARKKEAYDEWLAEQERRQAEVRLREAAQREKQRQRLANREPRELPKLKLNVPVETEEPLAGMEEMTAWHEAYAAQVVPVKTALARYLEVQGPSRTEIMLRACRDLSRTISDLLEGETISGSPDRKVATDLDKAFNELKLSSDACIRSRLKVSRDHLAAGQRALGEAAAALGRYSLGL